jgi:hypothetical protein
MPQAVRELHLPWTYLEDGGVEIDGVSIWGTPWVPGLPRWAFSHDSSQAKLTYSSIPKDIDILVTHGPPYGTADTVGPRFGGPKCVGDTILKAELDRIAPKTVVCGHIHEAYGYYRRQNLYSVSLCDDYYRPVQEPQILQEYL